MQAEIKLQVVQESSYDKGSQRCQKCPLHYQSYRFYCCKETCGQLICSNPICIESHSHQNQKIQICKINWTEISPIPSEQQVSQACLQLQNQYAQLKEVVDTLKQSIFNLFQTIKSFKEKSEYLCNNEQALSERYIQELTTFVEMGQQLEASLTQIRSRIDPAKDWIALTHEIDIVTQLRLQFSDLSELNFDPSPIRAQQFYNRWNLIQQINNPFEGVISLLYTNEGLVIGQFIANSQVELCTRFLRNFFFVVDQKGRMIRFNILEDIVDVETVLDGSDLSSFIYSIKLKEGSVDGRFALGQTGLSGIYKVEKYVSFMVVQI